MISIYHIKQKLSIRSCFIFCLSTVALGLSLSKALMFTGLVGFLIVWFIDGNYNKKITAFFKNKTALIISSIYLLSLLGLFYTSNFEFALGDIRRKIPLFFFPFFFVGINPLSKKELHLLVKVFISGVVIASLWSLFVYLGGLKTPIVDKRELSRFSSHIRFGLEIALSLFFSLYYFIKSPSLGLKLLWGAITLWLLLSLYLFSLFSGTVVFFITLSLVLATGLFTKSKTKKRLSFSLFSILAILSIFYVSNAVNSFYNDKDVEPIKEIPISKNGTKYYKDLGTDNSSIKENGFFVEKNIAWSEFGHAWKQVGNIDFDGKDRKGNLLKNTLIRFVTSKGQRKDQEAIESLTPLEISAIENGIANYKYMEMSSIAIRLHKIIWEYDSYINGGNINGHSVLMRWEFWKTGIRIVKQNMLIGVGTGDVQDAFNLQYEKDKVELIPQYRLRAHNQYITHLVSFGILGFCWFLFCLFFPIIKTKLYKNYFYVTFFSILCLSMITEDTLETQAGINFFVFFNTIFLLNLNYKHEEI